MKNAKASGNYNIQEDNIRVEAGAIFEKEISNSFHEHNYLNLRNELLSSEKVMNFILQEDYLFSSLSSAAAVLGGRAAAGPLEWKTEDGMSIRDYLHYLRRKDDFIEYIRNHKDETKIQKSYEEVKAFKKEFVLESIQDLNLEEYDHLGSHDSFCYYLEYKTKSISGGWFGSSRNKLFYNKQDGTYDNAKFIDDRYPNKTINEKFEMYKEDLYRFITEFDKNNYVATDYRVLPNGANYIKSKLVSIYHTETILCIDSINILRKIAVYFGLNQNQYNDSIEFNIAILSLFEDESNNLSLSTWTLSDILWQYYQEYINEDVTENQAEVEDIEDESESEIDSLLFMDDAQINDIVKLLIKKKNLILQGSPGVGKTFSIDKIVKSNFEIDDAKQQILMIQFHQSFSYEEFIEGLRPNINDNGFDIKPGIFKSFIEEYVTPNPEKDYFLIIDEINRGNLSKIFGELLLLIESDKRGPNHTVKLPYSNENFYVPKNLYIIGTMNTADRSLALIDYALRRRFSFVDLKPMFDSDKFNSFLNQKGLKQKQVNKINSTMLTINEEIKNDLGENFEIGHSYFVSNTIEDFDQWYQNIMKYDILPLLKEYYFDNEEKINKFLTDLELL
jgi:5-methylcytosine-specific restriction endonuclease McrBC GTP-binding regulatory subunit McrB